MRTSTISVLVTRPSPPQVGQALRKRPDAAAARAGEAEFHGAGHLRHIAGAFALRAGDFAGAGRSGAVAGAADFVARDVETRLRAFDGLPEIDVHHVFEVAALFRLDVRLGGAAFAAEELREDIAEAARPGAALGTPSTGAPPAPVWPAK
jgi:hypothetical protein